MKEIKNKSPNKVFKTDKNFVTKVACTPLSGRRNFCANFARWAKPFLRFKTLVMLTPALGCFRMRKMNKKIILIDYENIQKVEELERIRDFDIKIIVGNSQNKIPFELVKKLQKFGESVSWIQVPGQGSNALDFFIAYYLGKYIESKRYEEYFILSKDSGYKPLVEYLKSNKIKIELIVAIKQLLPTSAENLNIDAFVENLKKLPSNKRPKKKETLITNLKNAFRSKSENEILGGIDEMFIRNILTEENGKLKYNL